MRGHARLVAVRRRLWPLAGGPGRPPGAHRLARALGARSRRARAARAESYNTPVAGGWLRLEGGRGQEGARGWLRLGGGSGRSQVGPGPPQVHTAWLAPLARAPDAQAPRGSRVITRLAGGWLRVGRRKGAVSCALAAALGARRCSWALPGARRLARTLGARSRRACDARAASYIMPGWRVGVGRRDAWLVAVRRRLRALAGAPGRPQARSAWLAPWARAPDAHAMRGPRVITRLWRQVCARDTQSVSCPQAAAAGIPRCARVPLWRAAPGPGPHRLLLTHAARAASARRAVRASQGHAVS